jgi:hypothetical protein
LSKDAAFGAGWQLLAELARHGHPAWLGRVLVLPVTPLMATRYHPSSSISLIISLTFSGTRVVPSPRSRQPRLSFGQKFGKLRLEYAELIVPWVSQMRPVVTGGAEVMDSLFPERGSDA